MKLSQLIKDIEVVSIHGDVDVEITDIQYDSRLVTPGSLFAALTGFTTDGHRFLPQAAENGAKAVLVGRDVDTNGMTVVRVADTRSALGRAAQIFFDEPSTGMFLAGITGTNGKTTVALILEGMFLEAGFTPGVIGTISYRYGDTSITPPHTTPQALDLIRLLADMRDYGVTHVSMEVSSHALDQGRADTCRFDTAIFTNLTQDHLDYHGDMETYFDSKARFFREIAGRGKETVSVVNIDDEWGRRLAGEIKEGLVTYGFKNTADISIRAHRADMEGVRGEIITPRGSFAFASNLLGVHNIYNIMAAVGGALAADIPLPVISRSLGRRIVVPGRLEAVDRGQDFLVLIDYAHTDDALKNVISTLRPLTAGRLITLFGCGGDRDKKKRPLMARAAAELSHQVIVTSDNPRTEDPNDIIEDILAGFEGVDMFRVEPDSHRWDVDDKVYTVLSDRREAIAFAVNLARPGDIVLIAGKGHEDYQIIGTTKYPFDDRVEAARCLDDRLKGGAGG
ncbi:MAG: UDP-N-acetylmuramoyl-L-alanyl-D-glutamate--2,6-diaminopimelate ligase [Deltaproteobacteria bacterium]|nr:UDP-N-acetylmuramoyl-L-alanyl-D-glutamate--2,6-diaminopimelate ligase [Candidatus Zymogenaceae bacterium]